jgi:hypothetical protein
VTEVVRQEVKASLGRPRDECVARHQAVPVVGFLPLRRAPIARLHSLGVGQVHVLPAALLRVKRVADGREVLPVNTAVSQAPGYRLLGKLVGVVHSRVLAIADAVETLFLRRGDDLAVAQQASRGLMISAVDSENVNSH